MSKLASSLFDNLLSQVIFWLSETALNVIINSTMPTDGKVHKAHISSHILRMKFSEFYLRNLNSCETWHSFSRAPIGFFFFGVTTDDLLHL